MKKILLSLLLVLPLLAYAYTPLFDLGNKVSSKHHITVPTISSDAGDLSINLAPSVNVGHEANLIEGDTANGTQNTAANNSEVKHESNTVPVPVALPLLAVAIALFGFGANRRRV